MIYDNNVFQNVVTFNKKIVQDAVGQNCFLEKVCSSLTKDAHIDSPKNLGAVINYEMPYNFVAQDGLVVNELQAIVQNVYSLTLTQQANVGISNTSQEEILNFDKEDFKPLTAEARGKALGAKVEQQLASHANSSATYGTTTSGLIAGQPMYMSGPTRFADFVSDGTGLTSLQQLAQMVDNFAMMDVIEEEHRVIMPSNRYAPIVANSLGQFVPKRNDETAASWELGTWGHPGVEYLKSNKLPIQRAGTIGNDKIALTVVRTNDPTGENITSITFSGAGSGDTINYGDVGYLLPTSGLTATTFYGHVPTDQAVQFRCIATVTADVNGNITVPVVTNTYTQGQGLNGIVGTITQNISGNIVAGMQAKFVPDHLCGLYVTGRSFLLAMPPLPNYKPFTCTVDVDPDTGCSMRTYIQPMPTANKTALVNDCIWDAVLISRPCLRICLPLTM